jgi:hypothetical protein
MATRPIWDKNPGLTPAQVHAKFGKGATLVQAGGPNGKWTIKGYTAPKPKAKPKAKPTTVQLNQAPREWQGSEGLIGSWKAEPRLNPDEYEWMKNDAGRWMARPRTELTGLNTQQRADIQNADRYADQHQNWTTSNWGKAADQTAADASRTAGHLTALNQQVGNSVRANDPTDAAMGQAAQTGNAAQIAAMIGNQGDQAGVLRAQGVSSGAQYRAAYDAARGAKIAEYRTAMQEAAAAQREQEQQYMLAMLGIQSDTTRAELNANTQLATTGMTVDGQNSRALLDAETDRGIAELRFTNQAADRAAKLNIAAARIEADLRKAQANNNTKRAIALQTRATKLRTDARKLAAQAKRDNLKNVKTWTDTARAMFAGKEVGGVKTFYAQPAIERTLRGMGATPEQARAIAYNVVNTES